MLGYELNVFIAPVTKGGDSCGDNVFIGFRLACDGDDVATDFTLDGESLDIPPDDLMDILPLPLYLACPLGAPVTVTRGDRGTVAFRFKRIESDMEEEQGYCFIDSAGRTVEICRTCGGFYAPFGDGYDGECESCADKNPGLRKYLSQ